MEGLKTYIRESIFDKDTQGKLEKTREEMALDQLRKYSYDNLSSYDKKFFARAAWEKGKILFTKEGIKIITDTQNPSSFYGTFVIYELKEPLLVKIAKVVGNIEINRCNIESLSEIFTDDCVIDGELYVRGNDGLKSLKGSPKTCRRFVCRLNKNLSIKEIKNGPNYVTGLYEWMWNKEESTKVIDLPRKIRDLIKKYVRGGCLINT